MTRDRQRKAAIRARMAETGEKYNVAARALARDADPSTPPRQPVVARVIEAGCSWWLQITDARYWESDNAGQYGYRPHFTHVPTTMPLTARAADGVLAVLGWERHQTDWPAQLAAGTVVQLRRTRDGFAEDRANRPESDWECYFCEDGEEECPCGGGDGYDCHTCGGTGYYVPSHCCVCGGAPYCHCCRTCEASCIGDCRCPAVVLTEDNRQLVF